MSKLRAERAKVPFRKVFLTIVAIPAGAAATATGGICAISEALFALRVYKHSDFLEKSTANPVWCDLRQVPDLAAPGPAGARAR